MTYAYSIVPIAQLAPYVDVAVLRWQAFTGHAATLESDGRTFAEISSAHATR